MDMTDDELKHIAYEVDEYLTKMRVQHKLPPLSLCGIVLARLAMLSNAFEMTNDFIHLLESSKDSIIENEKFNQENGIKIVH